MLDRAGCRKGFRSRRSLTGNGDKEDLPADWFKDPQHRGVILIGQGSENDRRLFHAIGIPPIDKKLRGGVGVVTGVEDDAFVNDLKTPGPADVAQSLPDSIVRNLHAGCSQGGNRHRRIFLLMDTAQSNLGLFKRRLDEFKR